MYKESVGRVYKGSVGRVYKGSVGRVYKNYKIGFHYYIKVSYS